MLRKSTNSLFSFVENLQISDEEKGAAEWKPLFYPDLCHMSYAIKLDGLLYAHHEILVCNCLLWIPFKYGIRSQFEDIPLLIVALHIMAMILTILVCNRDGIFAYFYRIELEDGLVYDW